MLQNSDLGIYDTMPKHQDMVSVQDRLETFRENWKIDKPHSPPSPETLASCGFYYSGYKDCVRCFYCGIGLKGWDGNDDPWVSHARIYPDCHYLRHCKGALFVDIVVRLSGNNKNEVYLEDVEREMKLSVTRQKQLAKELDDQYPKKADDSIIQAPPQAPEDLTRENEKMRFNMSCKICLGKDVAITFLPCAHFVTCVDCSFYIKKCFVCKKEIKNRVPSRIADWISDN